MNRSWKLKIKTFWLNFWRSSGVLVRMAMPLKVSLHAVLFKKGVEVAKELVVPNAASFDDLVVSCCKEIVKIVGVLELVFDPVPCLEDNSSI
jgi:hypothetical protein